MITLEVINIDSSFSLEDGSIQDYIVFRLPDGSISRALTDVETTKKLIGIATNGKGEEPLPSEAPIGIPMPVDVDISVKEEGKIAWRLLSNDTLSSMMKAALNLLNVSDELTQTELQQLVEHIAENFSEEDWARVQESVLQEAQPAPLNSPQRPAAAPPVNKVQWADGSPIVAGGAPARTVPADDMGYPVVPGEVDTGEIVGGDDVDEDGTSQF